MQKLKLELAVTIDAGRPFVCKTNQLQGDGPVALDSYQHLQEVATAAAHQHCPNTSAVAAEIAGGDEDVARGHIQYAKSCVKPAITNFLQRFSNQQGDLYNLVRTFKSARYFCPIQVQYLNLQPDAVDQLRLFPFLADDRTINALKVELPAYLTAVEATQRDVDRLS